MMKPMTKIRTNGALVVLVLAPMCTVAAATPIERQFDVHMTMTGVQSWKNGVQSTEGTTRQDYALSTRLRSNGVLYSDNLLDTDQQARIDIKEQYFARQGLLLLKAENGGKLPQTPEEVARLTSGAGTKALPCGDEFECHNQSIERFAALSALSTNSAKDLDEFLASPGAGNEPRYQYFFGYAGCPTRIHISYEVHIAGKRAYDHDRKKLVPWSLDRSTDTPGSDEDRKTLCEKYVVTVDTRTGTVFLENLFIPSPPGTSILNINGSVEKRNLELPPPQPLLEWGSARLRQGRDSGTEKAVLNMTLPLDGDSTVQGLFDGKLNVDMTWSIKPVGAAAPPASPAPKPK